MVEMMKMNNRLKDIVDLTNRNNYKLAIVKLCEYVDNLPNNVREIYDAEPTPYDENDN